MLQRFTVNHCIKRCHRALALEVFRLSDIGEGIREVRVKDVAVTIGQRIKQFDKVYVVESDKAVVDISSKYTGVVKKLYFKTGDEALIGQPLMDVETDAPSSSSSPAAPPSRTASSPVATEPSVIPTSPAEPAGSAVKVGFTVNRSGKVLCSPAVRAIAREHKLNLSTVRGTGKEGRILKEDVLDRLSGKAAAATESDNVSVKKVEQAVQIVPVTGVLKAMFRSMDESLKIPMFSCSDEINMNKLMVLRQRLKRQKQKITYLPFILKALSMGFKEYPILNSTINAAHTEIHVLPYHNISVAIDSPRGLVVPNIKNIEAKTIEQIASELNDLTERARDGKLTPTDFANGTFSVSNVGTIGAIHARPVVFPPQVAIGALGKIQCLPRYNEKGEVTPVNVMQVSWSADHRVIDGATMVRFSNLFIRYLENPDEMLLKLA